MQQQMKNIIIYGNDNEKPRAFIKKLRKVKKEAVYIELQNEQSLKEVLNALSKEGYSNVKILNFDNPNPDGEKFNPFHYIHNDIDIMNMSTSIMCNECESSYYPIRKAEAALLNACIGYLIYFGEHEEQNFSDVLRLLRACNVDEADYSLESALDKIFAYPRKNAQDLSLTRQYDIFKLTGNTVLAKSIVADVAGLLSVFDLEVIWRITQEDTVDFYKRHGQNTATIVIATRPWNKILLDLSRHCYIYSDVSDKNQERTQPLSFDFPILEQSEVIFHP